MLEGLGNFGNLKGLIKQALDIKGKVEELRETLGNERIEAASGGGMVRIVMTGKFELESIKIDPDAINRDDPEMLETLVRAAINEGVRKAQDLVKAKMAELTGGIDVPGIA